MQTEQRWQTNYHHGAKLALIWTSVALATGGAAVYAFGRIWAAHKAHHKKVLSFSRRITSDIEDQRDEIFHVFFNVYIGPNAKLAVDITREQLHYFATFSKIHTNAFFEINVITVGQNASVIPASCKRCFHIAHHPNGSEALTLQHLYEHCKAHRASRVIYIHDKGSFHDVGGLNAKLRRFHMDSVTSQECLYMPSNCSVCSGRFSPLPHPHTPGTMWVARCGYIARLIPPIEFESAMESTVKSVAKQVRFPPHIFSGEDWFHGIGRYSNEHWVHSHPTVVPCDVYQGFYFWGYPMDMPTEGWTPKVHVGLRFPLQEFAKATRMLEWLQAWRTWRCLEYKQLYKRSASNETLAALNIGKCDYNPVLVLSCDPRYRPVCKMSPYVEGSGGKSTCPAGYSLLTDVSECLRHGTAADVGAMNGVGNVGPYWCAIGCFHGTDTRKVYYSYKSSGSCNSCYRPVCKKAPNSFSGNCMDNSSWADVHGDGCSAYRVEADCTCDRNGMWANANGVSADIACCKCGGGTT